MSALLLYFKSYLKETILGPLFKLLEASFELFIPLIIASIIDHIIPQSNQSQLIVMILLLFGLALLGVIVSITAQYFSSKAAIGYTEQLSDDLFHHIMHLSQSQRDLLGTSSLVTRMVSDTYQIQTGINQFLRLFLRSPFIVFGSVIMALTISPTLTTYFLMMVVALLVAIFVMSRLLNPLYSQIRQLTDALVAKIREQLEGVRVIRAFDRIDSEEMAFQHLNNHYYHQQIKAGILSSLVGPVTIVIVNVTLIAVIWRGAVLIEHSLLSQGMLVALINYLLQILAELLKMTMLVTSLNQSFISAKRVQAIFDLDIESEKINLSDETSSRDLSGMAIVTEKLTFRYPNAGKAALEDISFTLASGQSLGIIGGTGSGKSTLVALLTRLYQAQSGQLLLSHKGATAQSVKEWRGWTAVVPQKAQLFNGSIRSNLQLGQGNNLSDQDMIQALSMAQAWEFVHEKEGQLEAEVAAFGRNFSGGQRQRLTIARAILRRAPFLILDDATSALDYLTERRLLEAINQERQESGGHLIIVSQRTRSLKEVDKILVLDQGKLLAQGSHEELLETCHVYRDIHFSQESQEA
ncbi:ABC transporter ATP-binding protein [Streptococcus hyovaginalis]|uniref:ABC transporter ATP-binding protein n=1 Tax=Streptococcus hyovaginalis TaxID=149015 RepID=UPI002A83BFC3|nr:ABC transporter ATP-binding protein [Streptococcus hyovaginalis]MDY4511598.1 ABC transporter ATP-binding protein [Streptococcus hyovaginalis]MDY5974739.1 ABC transporter ATP-binding protein [Streptococcus hyovaginalis]